MPERPGEGFAVTSTRHNVVNVDGVTGVSLTADFSSAPVPDRRYVADVASVVRVDDIVQLIFGQQKVGTDDLRSLVVIHMSCSAIRNFLDNSETINTAMRLIKTKFSLSSRKLIDIKHEPTQTVALAASIIMASVSGREACLDFYYSSPYVAVQVAQGGKFMVDPTARIMLPVNLLLSILEKLDEIKADLPTDAVMKADLPTDEVTL